MGVLIPRLKEPCRWPLAAHHKCFITTSTKISFERKKESHCLLCFQIDNLKKKPQKQTEKKYEEEKKQKVETWGGKEKELDSW